MLMRTFNTIIETYIIEYKMTTNDVCMYPHSTVYVWYWWPFS